MKRAPALAAVAVAVVASLALAVPGPDAAAAGPAELIERSRRVAGQLRFAAHVIVRWVDAVGTHEAAVDVLGDGDRVVIDGPLDAVAIGEGRLVLRPGGWAEVWPSGTARLPRPPLERKYSLESRPGERVAGRPTTLVDLRVGGVLRERLAVDAATGLVLRRVLLGADGAAVRVVSVERLELGDVATPAPRARARDADRPRPVAPSDAISLARAARTLAGGYELVGAYRRSGLLHLLYSDGLHGISLFAQPGRLQRSALQAPVRSVPLGGATAMAYAWPGGDALVWQGGQMVYTLVGDGPADELLAAAGSLPAAQPPSLSARIRRVCRTVAETLSGTR